MEFTLQGQDFQSWKSFTLNAAGFTVIVGASDLGKSAVIRALRGVVRNNIQASHIRKGVSSTQVTLTLGDTTATATRNNRSVTYTVNGQEYTKLSGGVPPEIQALKLEGVKVGDTTLDPIFAGQFDSQFMLDMSPSNLNAVLGLFSDTTRLEQGKKAIAQANTKINAQAELLAKSIQKSRVKLAALTDCTDVLTPLRDQYALLQDQINGYKQALKQLSVVQRVQKSIYRLQTVTEIPLSDPASLTRLTASLAHLAHHGKTLERVEALRQVVQSSIPSVQPLSTTYQAQQALAQWCQLDQTTTVREQVLKVKLPEVAPCTTLHAVVGLLHHHLQGKTRASVCFKAASATPVAAQSLHTKLVGYTQAQSLVNSLLAQQGTLNQQQHSLKSSIKEVEGCKHDLATLTSTGTMCPQCGYFIPKDKA